MSMSEFEDLVVNQLRIKAQENLQLCWKGTDGKFISARGSRDVVLKKVAAMIASGNPYDVWYGPNPVIAGGRHGKAKSREVTRVTTVVLDVDFKDSATGGPKEAMDLLDALVESLGLQHVLAYHTGGGLQFYVPLSVPEDEPAIEIAYYLWKFQQYAQAMSTHLGYGQLDNVSNPAHIFRVPGTRNQKSLYQGKPLVHRVYGAFYTATEDSVQWLTQEEMNLGDDSQTTY